ncbi:MAG: response regulator [Caldilineaceae bacterium]|nr:response regulator [Caldilineaceae bacterium]MBP8107472.1 response regulator [Caldilineaceae bacterium]MBP8122379.1 response regulator [Caldilineaceae bacterium]MBP9073571.1 response regulator [Caldilineaceae bacterium]
MPDLFLTPASISYLTQFILAQAISLFLIGRLWKRRTRQLGLLTGFFALATLFIGLMLLDAAFSPYHRLLAVYAENTVLALALVFLIQFAYGFPQPYPQHKWETYAALVASLGYFLWEAGYMIYRYVLLLGPGTVVFRPNLAAYSMALILALAPVAFVRQSMAADGRSVSWLRKLWKPQGNAARGARAFVLVFGILFVLGLFNVFLIFTLPHTVYNAAMSLGVLTALWLFATNYINFVPGGVSVQAKLSILTLTLFLALLGSVGWLIAPSYIVTFDPDLTDGQTVRFTPNAAGGYDVEVAPFHFEAELGEIVQVSFLDAERNYPVEFAFPFFGKIYTDLFVSNAGVITFGEPYWPPNMQAATARTPALFPLLIELDTRPKPGDGRVYVRETPDRLIVTWYHVPGLYQPQALNRPEAIYTFQAVLYINGTFDFTTNGLPLPILFDPDATPAANPWLRGAVSGLGEPLHTNAAALLATAQAGDTPLIENYQLAFRHYLHEFMMPLAGIVLGGSLLLILVLPLLFRFAIIRPLETLTHGMRRMEDGDLAISLPVQNQDEIGYLTGAFNGLVAQLGDAIRNLEARVTARTADLDTANAHLRAEIAEREQVEATVIEQQRTLAAFEERVRLSRDLHDGLGQVMGYLNVQAQAVQTLLADGQPQAAQSNLTDLTQATQDAYADIRNHILGLRTDEPAPHDFMVLLDDYVQHFGDESGLVVSLSLPTAVPDALSGPLLVPAIEEQALHIIQEALANVRKHAHASRVEVAFSVAAEQVQIVIGDDGVGFAIADFELRSGEPSGDGSHHFGLEIMRERAVQAGGQVEVRSAPGQGTQVLVTLPRFLPAVAEGETGYLKGLRLLLVDDHPLFLDGLRTLLRTRGLTVVGVAHDGLEAQEKARLLHPDVVVMDLNMPRCDGLTATRAIKAELPQIKIVILTVAEDEAHLFEAIKSGASGYLLKNLDANKFCTLLTGLVRGDAPLAPGLAERILSEFAQNSGPDGGTNGDKPSDPLTERQQEILGMVAEGLTYKEIAATLFLSEKTIKYHMGRIQALLQVESRAEAIAFYHQQT